MSDAKAVDPEEAFVASLSSCHMLWFLDFAARSGYIVDRYEDDATGEMGRDERGRIAMLKVVLRPKVAFASSSVPDRHVVKQLHDSAHESCFIANSVRTQVVCEPVHTLP